MNMEKIKIRNSKTKILLVLGLLMLAVIVGVVAFGATTTSVYASNGGRPWQIDVVPIEEVEVYENGTSIRALSAGMATAVPGESISLSAHIRPQAAVITMLNLSFEITSGAAHAQIVGDNLVINNPNNHASIVGGQVSVVAIADGVRSKNTLTFEVVRIPVLGISISNFETQIMQGGSLQLNTSISPSNASFQGVTYEIISGGEYADISQDGLIQVNSFLPRGDLSVRVRATSADNPSVWDERVFCLYVSTSTLSISSNGNRRLGEAVILSTNIDSRATILAPNFTVISGNEFVQSLSGNTLLIRDNITAFNPQIIVQTSRDGLTATYAINVYVPATNITISTVRQEMMQGESEQISVSAIAPTNASRENLRFALSQDSRAFADIDPTTGFLTARTLPNANAVETIQVHAYIGNLRSNTISIDIVKPDISLESNVSSVDSSRYNAGSVILTVEFDGENVTNRATFNIIRGSEWVVDGAVSNGTFTVRTNITAQNPSITLVSIYNGFTSNEITIPINVLIDRIAFNHVTTQVEQSRTFDFSASASSANRANITTGIRYSVNVGANIATINQSTGLLTVTGAAGINSTITITALHEASGVTATRSVTVREVFASNIQVTGARNSSGLISASNPALPNQVLNFDVTFFPDNVSAHNRAISVQSVSNTGLATISGSNVQIRAGDAITGTGRTFTATIRTTAGTQRTAISNTISVHVPITNASLSFRATTTAGFANNNIRVVNGLTYISEGSTVRIADLVNVPSLQPDTHSGYTNISYSLTNVTHARIENNERIVVNNSLPSGNLSITLRATITQLHGNTIIADRVIHLYVAPTAITWNSNINTTPVSWLNTGGRTQAELNLSNVSLGINADSRATFPAVIFRVISGGELIQGSPANNSIINANFTVAANAASRANKTIRVSATRDGESRELVFTVYAPVQQEMLSNMAINRGSTVNYARADSARHTSVRTFTVTSFNVVFPSNTGRARIPLSGNATNFALFPGTLTASNQSNFIVNSNLPGGTIITINYRANETRAGVTAINQSATFTVGRLIAQNSITPVEEFVTNINNATMSFSNFKLVYQNSDSTRFLTTSRQLENNTNTLIRVMWHGAISLSSMGLSAPQLNIIGGTGASYTNSGLGTDRVRLNIADNASGRNNNISYNITIVDGSFTYTLTPTRSISVFRRITSLSLSNTNITAQNTNLSTRLTMLSRDNLSPTATTSNVSYSLARVSNTQFYSFSGATLRVDRSHATDPDFWNPQIVLSVQQVYNDSTAGWLNFSTVISMNMVHATLELNGGSSGQTRTAVVSAVNERVEVPTRRGHIFNGFWTAASGGTQRYDSWGWRTSALSISSHTLFARWTPITYTINYGWGFVNGSLEGSDRMRTVTFGSSQSITAPSVSGHTFSHWSIWGTSHTFTNNPITTATIEAFHLPSNGGTFFLDAHYNPNPSGGGCVVEGTMITLANGATQVRVEDLREGDEILVWNFFTGQFDVAPVFFIAGGERMIREVLNLQFANGSSLRMVYQHSFFNMTLNRFVDVHAENILDFVGHYFKQHSQDANGSLTWTAVRLDSVEFTMEEVRVFAPVTHRHFVKYANGFLAGPSDHLPFLNVFNVDRDTLAFCTDDIEALKSEFGLMSFEEFNAILPMVPEFFFNAYRGELIGLMLGSGRLTIEQLIFMLEKYSDLLGGIF